MAGWATTAILYSNLPAALRPWIAGSFGTFWIAVLFWQYHSLRVRLSFLAVFILVLIWWLNIPPSNDRDWQPDLATLASAEITGNNIIIRNIRNCDYRTETDFTCHYYDKEFDLAKLKNLDFYLV